MRRLFAISLAFFLTAHTVRASEGYPDVIRATVSTDQPLPCTLCHALSDGGDGAVTTVFGGHMIEFGMQGGNPASLQTALRRNAARVWDSDGDGVPDIEELIYGSDPSTRALSSGPPLMHGCAVGRSASGSDITAGLFALIAWSLRRRRGDRRTGGDVSHSAGARAAES